jgi:cellulose synthase/poly-beta-1,6-N-acetylglucosamine synthase-like glycosyltransferase
MKDARSVPVGEASTGGRGAGEQAAAWPKPSEEVLGFFFSEVEVWRPILESLKVDPRAVFKLVGQAAINGTDFQSELLASGLVNEQDLFRAVASEFGVRFLEEVDPERLIMKPEHQALFLSSRSRHLHVWTVERGQAHPVIAPSGMSLSTLKRMLLEYRTLAPVLCMTTPGALRRAILDKASATLADQARNGLHERLPAYSARIIASIWQAIVLGAVLVILPLGMVLAPQASLLTMHVFFSIFFLACVGLRFAAATVSPVETPPDLARLPADRLPFYSVLVALHREADVIPQLVEALGRIDWPRSKLEIKLVCEADDRETLDAIAANGLPPHFEVVRVPPCLPRTKPKALNYAIPLIKGDFVVLYDAEDRPHPLQLREAWHRFRDGSQELACVQAPLEISNGQSGIIPMLFAFEYSALFRGLLPWLAGRRGPLPLGGTSNHFKVPVLKSVGCWDPHNVTEDADLGIRLARFGYSSGTISLPTLEDAPRIWPIWLPQRSRWFKGWMVTWLVHMRDPALLWRDLGARSFFLAQILCAGLVLSALVHPVLWLAAAYLLLKITLFEPVSGWPVVLLTADMLNIVCGYLSFLLLGWHSLKERHRWSIWRIVLCTPYYWMMMSMAAWRAFFELWRRPYYWAKTPHVRTESPSP